MPQRQQVLILYLSNSALDSRVLGWSFYDGTAQQENMAGDQAEPPYATGLHALRDGWRLIQAAPLIPHNSGDEFRTGYLKYEFLFEKLIDTATPERIPATAQQTLSGSRRHD